MTKRIFSFALLLSCLAAPLLAAAEDHTHWSYTGKVGPKHWGALDPAYASCASGKNQSPINIQKTNIGHLNKIEFHYQPGGSEVINNGHTVQINVNPGSTIIVDGQTYELKQFHFHVPSENHIHGKSFPMEMHLVHADASGKLAVVAVMFEKGKANTALNSFWASLPMHENDTLALLPEFNAESLLPAEQSYYRFDGSLTTPPCTEGVSWLVLKSPLSASSAQVKKLLQALPEPNSRPIQPLHERHVAE